MSAPRKSLALDLRASAAIPAALTETSRQRQPEKTKKTRPKKEFSTTAPSHNTGHVFFLSFYTGHGSAQKGKSWNTTLSHSNRLDTGANWPSVCIINNEGALKKKGGGSLFTGAGRPRARRTGSGHSRPAQKKKTTQKKVAYTTRTSSYGFPSVAPFVDS